MNARLSKNAYQAIHPLELLHKKINQVRHQLIKAGILVLQPQ
jgi:hypothetical protein